MIPAKTYSKQHIMDVFLSMGYQLHVIQGYFERLDQSTPAEPEKSFAEKWVDNLMATPSYGTKRSENQAQLILDLVESKVNELRKELMGDGRK